MVAQSIHPALRDEARRVITSVYLESDKARSLRPNIRPMLAIDMLAETGIGRSKATSQPASLLQRPRFEATTAMQHSIVEPQQFARLQIDRNGALLQFGQPLGDLHHRTARRGGQTERLTFIGIEPEEGLPRH